MFIGLCSAIIIAIVLGVLTGIITGLTPGVHINLVSAMLLSMAPVIAQYAPLLAVAALIVSMSVTHTFCDTIPSIFLGAPDDDKAMGVLPGHRYLLRGNGLMAVKLCVVGGMIGILLSAILFLPMIAIIGWSYKAAKSLLFWVMLIIILFTILKDKKRWWAATVFMMSGLLGVVTLRLPLNEPLLPLLSGIFGVATLLYSINENQTIPLQRDERYTQLEWGKTMLGSALGIAAGFLTALLPGVSASSASAVVSQGSDLGDHGFLVLLGSLGSASFLLSLAAFIAIEKARNGAMAVIVQLTPLSTQNIIVLLAAAIIGCGAAAIITIWLGRRASCILPRIPYRTTCIGVIFFVMAIVLWRAGPLGLLVLATSTAVGLLPAALKTARAQAMGCLLLPLLVLLW